MIEIKHIKKEYTDITPLKDINAIINKGDVISLIGPSGTGKSTLLRCINRLDDATSGEIIFNGNNIYDPKYSIHDKTQGRAQFPTGGIPREPKG